MSKFNTTGRKTQSTAGHQQSGFKKSGTGLTSAKPQRFTARPKRTIKSFDPTLLIKRVEEQVSAPSYVAKHAFQDFKIADQLKQNIAHKGYIHPTPIQDQVIPILLEGRDVIASANTGTGKTAAFLIPLITNVLANKTERVLIITPTRELASQIQDELTSFAVGTGISSVVCIGGSSLDKQAAMLRKNPQFVIGTPGRLLDLEKNRLMSLYMYSAIVLDEVDTMLDMGFINDIRFIIKQLPTKRHSLFFSATIPAELKSVMNSFLTNPATVSVKTRQTSENVNQDVIKIGAQSKIELLHDLLIKPEYTKVIVFSRMKHATDKLAKSLKERGFEIAAIHGDKTQAQRQKALAAFKDNHIKILLATDVVARGIDIDDVSHVINYDLPETYENYIHRIGRTGRANRVGQAISFVE